MKNNKPQNYKNYTIQIQGNGFKSNELFSGEIASFWVVSETKVIRSIFAFAIGLTDLYEIKNDDENTKINLAINTIKEYIDQSKISDLEEYTFIYKSHRFSEISNPKWWNKSLKDLLKN